MLRILKFFLRFMLRILKFFLRFMLRILKSLALCVPHKAYFYTLVL